MEHSRFACICTFVSKAHGVWSRDQKVGQEATRIATMFIPGIFEL